MLEGDREVMIPYQQIWKTSSGGLKVVDPILGQI